MMACALPLRSRAWHTRTGAARVLLVVNVPAATHGTSDAKIARSGIELSDLIPQDVVPARKPCGAVTQLSISRNLSDNEAILLSDRVLSFPLRYSQEEITKARNAGTGNQIFVVHFIVLCS